MAVYERNWFERWVRASGATYGISRPLPIVIQGLAKMERIIALGELVHFQQTRKCPAGMAEIFTFDLVQALSYFWVLGAYEISRTLTRLCEKNKACRTCKERSVKGCNKCKLKTTCGRCKEKKTCELNLAHRNLKRLRVQLAKIEPAEDHRSTDFMFPSLEKTSEQELCWRVSRNVFFTRKELSDQLLNALESMRERQLR